MRVQYDREVDAAYVYFNDKIKAGEVKQTITLNENFILDLDKDGKLLGLEVLNAAENLAKQTIKELRTNNKKPTTQAI